MIISVFDRVENIVGKGENVGYQHFLLFQQCFEKASVPDMSKGVMWEWLNPFPNKPWILRVCIASLLKTLWEKEKLLITSNFSFSHRVFYMLGELSAISIEIEIVVCKLLKLGIV